MRIQFGQRKPHFTLGDGLVVIAAQNQGSLDKLARAATPTGPEAELEESEGKHRGGDHADHANDRLLPAGFRAHVLAEHAALQVGENCVHVLGHSSQRSRIPQRMR